MSECKKRSRGRPKGSLKAGARRLYVKARLTEYEMDQIIRSSILIKESISEFIRSSAINRADDVLRIDTGE